MPDAKALDQRRMDELGGAELAQTAIEGQAQHQIDTLLVQEQEFFTKTGQPGGRLVRSKILAWLWLENNHAAGQAEIGGALAKTRQDGLVPPVNTVEIADGGDAPPMPGPQVMKTSNQLHTALLD